MERCVIEDIQDALNNFLTPPDNGREPVNVSTFDGGRIRKPPQDGG